MKIAHILNNFLPDHIAGTEVYAFHLGKELKAKGHEVFFIIPNYHQTQNEEYHIDGMRVIKYAEPSVVDKALQMGRRTPDGLKNFIEVLRNEKPVIVNFHELAGSNGITLAHVEAAKRLGLKVVMTFHLARYTATSDTLPLPEDVFDNRKGSLNFYYTKGFSKGKALLLYYFSNLLTVFNPFFIYFGKIGTALSVPSLVRKKKEDFLFLMKNIDKGVVIARWYETILKEHGIKDEKLSFIEQGIKYNSKPHKKMELNSGFIRFVFVGRISHFKGVRELIQVFNQLSYLNIHLDIYGKSGDNDEYISNCKNIAERGATVCFKGNIDPANIISTLSQYDTLILPSTFSEMSPLVIREAFAAGIPVLASDSRGSQEQITDGVNGWLFRMNDWNDLSEKLQWLACHPEVIREAARHLPQSRTFVEVAKDYDTLYKSILKSSEVPAEQ